jgi:Domain of unknown function (DUF4397)
MIKQLKSIALLAIAGIIAASVVSCQEPDYPAPQQSSAGPNATSSRVRFANASNAAGLSLFVENTAAGSTLALGQSTDYVALPLIASAQFRAKGPGGTLGTNDLSQKFTVAAGTNYTVFVTDSIARPRVVAATGAVTDAGGVRFLQVTDNLAAPVAGNAHVRFFHLAPDAPAVSVRLQATAPASVTTTATLLNRAYRVTTVTSGTVTTNFVNFTPVPAATYNVQVFAGATIPTSATVAPVVSVSGLTLVDGKIYTIFARGLIRERTLGAGLIQHN